MKYRRIEVNAFRRRVMVVSGVSDEWSLDKSLTQQARNEEGVTLTDSAECEPVEPTSPEGQLMLIEAVKSLESRLSPEARAALSGNKHQSQQEPSFWWLSFCRDLWPKALGLIRREK